MINRYTYAPIGRTPHMEPIGAGEWVKWDDHASHIAAANQRHAAALEAVALANDKLELEKALTDGAHRRAQNAESEAASYKMAAAECELECKALRAGRDAALRTIAGGKP